MNKSKSHNLTKNITIRIDPLMERNLEHVAKQNYLKPSTYSRIILARHLQSWLENNLPA